jgi:hypothetical protein
MQRTAGSISALDDSEPAALVISRRLAGVIDVAMGAAERCADHIEQIVDR